MLDSLGTRRDKPGDLRPTGGCFALLCFALTSCCGDGRFRMEDEKLVRLACQTDGLLTSLHSPGWPSTRR